MSTGEHSSTIEAMKQALEALETCTPADFSSSYVIYPWHDEKMVNEAITSLRQAIAEAEKREALERKTEDHDVDCLCSDCFALDDEVLGFNGWGLPIEKPEAEKANERSEVEPVAWMNKDETCTDCFVWEKDEDHTVPLYTSPPQRQWVGLTGDEVNEFAAGCHLGNSVQGAIRKAEAKLKEKNT